MLLPRLVDETEKSINRLQLNVKFTCRVAPRYVVTGNAEVSNPGTTLVSTNFSCKHTAGEPAGSL